MGLFGFGRNDENKIAGTTVGGYGGQSFLSSDSAARSFLSGIGQTTDSVTGITGRTATEAYERYKATGANADQLSAFVQRIGRH